MSPRTVISGWGRAMPAACAVETPESLDAVRDLSNQSGELIARGLGRSYGDAAQLSGSTVIDMTRLNRILDFNEQTGVVDVEAGVSIDHLIRTCAGRGWFVHVTPGTRYVTVGGAIASDVHGKSHHVDGSFGAHVIDLTLLTADGSVRTVSATSDADIFNATVGGMGLTGIVLSARLALRPIETTQMLSTTERSAELDTLMARMTELDQTSRYTVAWIDTVAKGKKFGRGLITFGDHATVGDLPVGADPQELHLPHVASVPLDLPTRTLNRASVRAFNTVWFNKAPKTARPALTNFADFFHPLDMLGDWNRIYGRTGFLQYQFVVPDSASQLIATGIEAINNTGAPAFLSVLKRFGPQGSGFLSFPSPGWTLALDIPARLSQLGPVLDDLDEQIAAAGGRVYLSKDSRLRPEVLASMYPRLDQFRQVRAQLDPNQKFRSDLSNRIGI